MVDETLYNPGMGYWLSLVRGRLVGTSGTSGGFLMPLDYTYRIQMPHRTGQLARVAGTIADGDGLIGDVDDHKRRP